MWIGILYKENRRLAGNLWCLGLGGVSVALVVSPLALVGGLFEVFPDLALVHLVDKSSLGLCDKDDLLDQASLNLRLDGVDPEDWC